MPPLFRGRIDAQHLDQLCYFREVSQGVASRFVVAAQKVDVKDVFPRSTAHGARFDFAQADIAKRKYTERFEQRPGHILELKTYRGFVCTRQNAWLLPHKEEASKVPLVILDAGPEDPPSINGRRVRACNSPGMLQLIADHV